MEKEKVFNLFFMTFWSLFTIIGTNEQYEGFAKNCPRENLHFSKALSTGLIDIETDKSFEQCLKSCVSRPRCLSVNYFKDFLVCELNSVANKAELKQESGSVYTEIRHWMKESARKCGNLEKCDLNQKCVNNKCIISDCGPQPTVQNAYYTASLGMGIFSKVEYKCKEGYRLHGRSRIGCQKNGEWSFAKQLPECRKVDCGPPPVVSNADSKLINSSTEYGSLAEYACQVRDDICLPPIEMVEGTNTVLSCMSVGKWSKPGIQCDEKVITPWNCPEDVSSEPINVLYVLDYTCSMQKKIPDQKRFFQRITMSLTNVSTCIRVACYLHSSYSNRMFGFNESESPTATCNHISNDLPNYCNVGFIELIVIEKSLSEFEEYSKKRGFVIIISDHNRDYSTKDARDVMGKASAKNVHVISIQIGNFQKPVASNHDILNMQSVSDLDSLVDDCLNVMVRQSQSAIS